MDRSPILSDEMVIDLGSREPQGVVDVPLPGWRDRWRRVAARGGRLRWMLAVVMVLAGGMTAGAADPPGLRTVAILDARVAGSQIQLVGDLVLLQESHATWGAYDAGTGEHRWTISTSADSGSLHMVAWGDLVLQLPAGIARDAETGEPVWQHTKVEVVPGQPVGVWHEPLGNSPGAPSAGEVAGIDLATGEDRWRFSRTHGQVRLLEGEQPVLVITYPDGVLELRDPLTGQVQVSRAVLPEQVRLPAEPLVVFDGHLVMAVYEPEGVALYGFRVDDLELVWEWDTPGPLFGMQPCGQAVCLGTSLFLGMDPTTRRIITLDPETGEILDVTEAEWQLDGLVVAAATGKAVPVQSPDTLVLAGGRVLQLTAATGHLVDPVAPPDTEPVADLAGWRLSGHTPHWADQVRQLPRLVALLPEPAGRPGAPVAVLDTVTGEITEHPWVPGEPEHCLAAERRLACRYGAQLYVWSW